MIYISLERSSYSCQEKEDASNIEKEELPCKGDHEGSHLLSWFQGKKNMYIRTGPGILVLEHTCPAQEGKIITFPVHELYLSFHQSITKTCSLLVVQLTKQNCNVTSQMVHSIILLVSTVLPLSVRHSVRTSVTLFCNSFLGYYKS